MSFEILTSELLVEFTLKVNESPVNKLNRIKKPELQVDYFQFYKSVFSVYSSKIEGEEIDFDSYFKHKFMKVKLKSDCTKKADDLYAAYEFIDVNKLTLENVKKTHATLSSHILPKSRQGKIRNNPMYVINSNDQIEYVASSPGQVNSELKKLFREIEKNYWQKQKEYYNNIRKPGLEYEELDYKKSLDFLLMTVQSLNEE